MNTLIKLIALFFFISVAFGEFQLMKKSRGYSEAVDYLTLKIKKTTCAEFLKKGGLGDRIRGGYSHHCLPVSSKGEDVDDLKFIGRCLNHDKDIILSIIEIHGKKSSDKNDKHDDDEKKYEKKGKIARSFTTREENDEKQFYLRLQAKEEPIEFKIKHFNLKNGHAYQVRRPACIKAKNHCETSKRSAEEMMVIDCLPRKQSKGKVDKDETVYIEITRRDERPDTCKDAKNGYCCRYVSASKNQGICKLYKSKGGRKDSNKGNKQEGPVTGVLGKLGQKPKEDTPGVEGNSYGETKPTEEKDVAVEYNVEEETKSQEESKHEDKAEPKKEEDDEKRSLIKKTVEVPKSVAEVKSDEGEEFEIEDEDDPFKDEEKKDVAAPATPVVEMKKDVAPTESKDEIVQRSKKDILPLETKKESIEPVKKDAIEPVKGIEPVKVIEPIKKDTIEPVKAAVEQTTVLEMSQVESVPEKKEEVKSTIAKRDVIVGNKAKKEEDEFDLWSEINDDKSTLEEEEEKEKEEEKAKESQPKKTSDNKNEEEEEEEEKEEKEKEEKEKLAQKQKEDDDEKKRNAEQKKSLGKTQQASAPETKKEEKPVAKEEKKQETPVAKKEEEKKQEAAPKKEKSEEEEEKEEKEREKKEKEEDEKDKKEEEEEKEREEKEEKEDKEKEEEEEREDKMKKEGSEEEEEEEHKKKEEEEEEEKRNIKSTPAKSADASTTVNNSKTKAASATPAKNAPVVIDSKQLLDEAEKEMADEFAKKK